MLLSLALIVKDEERTLARCLDSVRGAVDEIVIVDTGSTDGTKALARRYTDRVFDFAWTRDFAAARQFAFDQARGDWVIWLDADDVVRHADRIRPLVAGAAPDVGGFYWPYVYARDAWGNARCEFWRERCVRNDGTFRWAGRIHEALVSRAPREMVRCAGVVVEHRPDPARADDKLARNLAILAEEATAPDVEPRTLFYLGRDQASAGNVREALAAFQRCVRVATWDDERYVAQTRVAELLRELGRYDEAIDADLEAVKLEPRWPDAYFGLARTYYHRGDWRAVIHWTDVGRAMPRPDTLQIVNPMDYRYAWIIYYTNALYHAGELRQALRWTRRALELCPDDVAHRENFLFFARALQERDDRPHARVAPARSVAAHGERPVLPSVAFVAPLVWQPWSPRVLATRACGGSETAAIHMARQLAGLGHPVSVFNHCDGEGRYDGVRYMDAGRFGDTEPPHVLVAWRAPEVVDRPLPDETLALLWMHDLDVGERLTPERAGRFDAVLALSKAHRRHLLATYPFLDPARVWITRNGIDLSLFEARSGAGRHRRRLIYSSSPDRGLDVLLSFFPRIRARVPEAELHVFYGFDSVDLTIAQGDPRLGEHKARVLRLLDQPGVVHRGGVSQAELAREFQGASVWCHPTDFHETSCITAMEAQVAGCIPVTRPLAALAETVLDGVLIDGDVRSPDVQERYVDAVCALLEDPARTEALRRRLMERAAAAFAWEPVARQWQRWFTRRECAAGAGAAAMATA